MKERKGDFIIIYHLHEAGSEPSLTSAGENVLVAFDQTKAQRFASLGGHLSGRLCKLYAYILDAPSACC